jgi:putative transposase
MLVIVSALLRWLFSWFRPKHELAPENLALRHQIAVLKRPAHTPRLQGKDRLFWVVLKGWWPSWRAALIIFQPDTVIGWQRTGFRMFWRWKSRPRGGRPRKDTALVRLIRRMWASNSTWGSPRIRDELAKLGLEASTATIRKYRPKSRRQPSQNWRTFLQNHAGAIAALDFFVVPTVTFHLLYVLVVMTHEQRKVVHFNITVEPTAVWTAQSTINAFPYDTAPKYLLRDRDSIYGSVFVQRVEGMGIQQKNLPEISLAEPLRRAAGGVDSDVNAWIEWSCSMNGNCGRFSNPTSNITTKSARTDRSHTTVQSRGRLSPQTVGGVTEMPLLGGLHHHYLREAAWAAVTNDQPAGADPLDHPARA